MQQATIVDCLGKPCPVPVIDLAKAVAATEVGCDVLLISDDPGAKVDVPVWCRMKSQALIDVTQTDEGWHFLVRRLS